MDHVFTGIVEELGQVDARDGRPPAASHARPSSTTSRSATRSPSTVLPDRRRLGRRWWEADAVDETLAAHEPRRPAARRSGQPRAAGAARRPARRPPRPRPRRRRRRDRRAAARPARALRSRRCCATSSRRDRSPSTASASRSSTPLDDGFTVADHPAHADVTTLGHKGPGARVNLEVDVIAKYVERLLAWKDALTVPLGADRRRRSRPSGAARSSSSSTTRTARTRAT